MEKKITSLKNSVNVGSSVSLNQKLLEFNYYVQFDSNEINRRIFKMCLNEILQNIIVIRYTFFKFKHRAFQNNLR